MLQRLVQISLLAMLFAFAKAPSHHSAQALKMSVLAETYVYICLSENSYVYHLDDQCRGLKSCSSEKKKVTLKDAVGKYERKICGWED